ncbi:MAG: sulfatase-like hydrolase/transferase [Thermoguttaceae bacterium]|nr:sulfatase-like hydrolase/transferase [Thermoguttaceae bacterium]
MTATASRRSEFIRAFFVALLPTGLFWLLCGTIYLTNILECSEGNLFLTVSFLAAPLGWFVILLGFQLAFLGRKPFALINALSLFFGMYLWIQANLFNWGFGCFDGTPFRIKDFSLFIIIEEVAQAALLYTVIVKRAWFSKKSPMICSFILFMQFTAFASATLYAYRNQEVAFHKAEASWMKYDVKHDTLFEFSSNRNIILLVIDSFPGYAAGRLFTEYPELKATFADFTYFPNCMSFSGGTTRNVPAILTGQVYLGEAGTTADFFASGEYKSFLKEAYTGSTSVPKRLKEAGYRVELYPEVRGVIHWDKTMADNIEEVQPRPFLAFRNGRDPDSSCFESIVNASMFRLCPTLLKKYSKAVSRVCAWNIEKTFCPQPPATVPSLFVGRDVEDPDAFFLSRLNEIASVKTFTPVASNDNSFTSSQEETATPQKASTLRRKTPGCFKYIHLYGTHVPHVRKALAAGDMVYDAANPNASSEFTLEWGYLRWIATFLDTLKKQNLYNDATIIIMGDHPQHYSLTTSIVPAYNTFRHEPHIYNQPMLLVKRAKETSTKMKTSSADVRTQDIAGTVLAAARITDSGLPSVFALDEETKEKRKIQKLKLARSFGSFLIRSLGRTPLGKVQAQSLNIQSSRPGHCFFTFQFPDVTQLVFFGDEDKTTKKAVLLRPTSPSRTDCYMTPLFTGDILFSKGGRDDNYQFVSTRISHDVWCQHIVPSFDQVPDGHYTLNLLESLNQKEQYRETKYNCIIHIIDGKPTIEIRKSENR